MGVGEGKGQVRKRGGLKEGQRLKKKRGPIRKNFG